MAKKYSLDIGSENMRYKKSTSLDAGLAQVTIICYYSDDISDYNEVWQEEYINGKKTKDIKPSLSRSKQLYGLS